MWILLSINNSRYQFWQVSVLIWSIELSISYVSLKSDNITYGEMSYVLAKNKACVKCGTLIWLTLGVEASSVNQGHVKCVIVTWLEIVTWL